MQKKYAREKYKMRIRRRLPDDLDIFIWHEIYVSYKEKNEITNWDIAKKYAKLVNEKEVNKIYKIIKLRLDSYCKLGLFSITKNGGGDIIYEMDFDQITFVKHKFADGFKNCLLMRIDPLIKEVYITPFKL